MFRGFWGLKIVPGKTYSQTVDASFRLSNAALGATVVDELRTSVVLTVDDKSFVLCSLTPGAIEQQTLDIGLTEGEEITFETQGNNEVHLTGNFIADDMDSDYDSDEEESDEMDLSDLSPEELKELIDEGLIDPETLLEDMEDEDYDSDDAEADMRIREITDEDEEEMIEDLESEEEPVPVPVPEVKIKKQAKKAELKRKAEEEEAAKTKKPKAKKEEPKKVKEEVKKVKEEVKEEPKKTKEEAKKEAKKAKSIELQGGVVAEVKKEGAGAGVKKGARVGMYYIGKLTTGKVFDQNTKGKPFWFRLGAGEVIKGWDIGIVGMKKGGERRLTIPAAMAYGKRGAPPDIPPNATLVFDIRLVEYK
ncbi:peptidylprolyl isomerase fpr3 [Coemansia sp. RSA 353]|nr:peptidylprolyl isomerase fpr3 [Coemansia sp. RSA 521]KAJ2224081.1 peptidylprolyl isomerase fpr3 [Coemansia sp. RSA 520]KAJ2226834.1 peptidylprolyl isomerase fpr3 [Coemansia sp. RSA 518]KAJ2282409.1 peptidylprolyl isomerase fpr3 [Coemansia sp. RSA 370]KAJ2289437.1 peptidylprolyl isomerase fpr3 [Coemansia sp. RSA 355]KAJ2296976.1 peptidylprolyl isomerase fpr3 [Coemansia sp. RSA 353]KAJ2405123.1 peptidylprolyl isomerase fpr3 [Coemansia sp. RSA 2526]KAJ2435486.1 peptidylprolyl isomerase fpr3 